MCVLMLIDPITSSVYFPNMSPADMLKASKSQVELFYEAAKSELRPIPGTIEFLQRVDAAGIPKCLVTNAPRFMIDALFPLLGLDKIFPKKLQVRACNSIAVIIRCLATSVLAASHTQTRICGAWSSLV
jgi:beta-phosphoglucomutase-like phosphatase (HAD superfamily)